MKSEKTELQKQFEAQTPTIKGVSTLEYLRTFITWFHFKYEKLYNEAYNQAIDDVIKLCKTDFEWKEYGKKEGLISKEVILKLKKLELNENT